MVKLLVVVLLFSFYLLAFGYWTKVKSNVMPFFDWFSIILIIAKNHNQFFLWSHVGACVYVPVNVYSNFILRWSPEPFENYLSSFRSKNQCALEPRGYQFICKIVLLKLFFVRLNNIEMHWNEEKNSHRNMVVGARSIHIAHRSRYKLQ